MAYKHPDPTEISATLTKLETERDEYILALRSAKFNLESTQRAIQETERALIEAHRERQQTKE